MMDQVVKQFFRFFRIIFAFPYSLQWYPHYELHLIPESNKRSVHNILWIISASITFLFWILIVVLLVVNLQEYLSVQKDHLRPVFHFMWIGGMFFGVITQGLCISCYTDVANLTNGIELLIHNLEAEHFGQESFRESKLLRRKILALFCGHMTFCILTCLLPMLIIFYGEKFQIDFYVSSAVLWVFPTLAKTAFIIGIIMDALYVFKVWGGSLFTIHINFLFMHTFKTAIQKIISCRQVLRRRSKQFGIPSENMFYLNDNTRSLRNDLFVYSKLRILATVYNSTFGRFYVPNMLNTFAFFFVQGIFIAVRLSKGDIFILLFGMSTCIGCAGTMCLLTTFMAMVHNNSLKMWRDLRGRTGALQGREGRRLVRSYKVEAVRNTSFHEIKRVTCLTMLGLVANISGSLLISIQI